MHPSQRNGMTTVGIVARVRVTALVVVLAHSLSCASESAKQASSPSVIGAPLEIAMTPMLSLGVLEGDSLLQFNRVVTPFRTSDGSVVVPVSGDNSIRIFDSNGAFLKSLGRSGSGPGEFRFLIAAWPRGDTIESLDLQLRRIMRFLPDGSVAVIALKTELADLSLTAGPLLDGWAVAGVAEGGLGRRDLLAIRRFARDGSDMGELAHAQGMARYAAGNYRGPEPLSPNGFMAVSADRIYVGESLVPSIAIYDPDGQQVDSVIWEDSPKNVPSGVLPGVIDSAVARLPQARREATRQGLEGAPPPGLLSLYWAILVDSEGFVWIRPYDPFVNAFALGARVGPGGTWRVFGPDGSEMSPVVVPAELELHQITSDAVVGIARDEFGVESVRVHQLRRR
jgi:hypothetical protein